MLCVSERYAKHTCKVRVVTGAGVLRKQCSMTSDLYSISFVSRKKWLREKEQPHP